MGDTDGAPGSNVTNVRVAVRCRPLNGREKGLNEPVCVRLTGDQVIITNPVPGGEEHSFAFDVVFDQNSLQTSVWEKVKAVKNEEASQISKLNDEIRLLKERLMREEGGGGGGGGSAVQVDTTALEEKHKQQLAELEEAMKNTWEEKARVSADHEKERRRLQKEQDQAVRESRKQKERAWKLLEDKSDLELAMIHVRDIARRDSNILAFITQWQLNLKEISRLEQQLGEQDTVVDIYRSSVHKDTDVLIKGGGGGGGNSGGGIQRAFSGVSHAATPRSAATHIHMDKTTLSLWKQLKDKFGATQTEVQKWAQMQDELSNKVNLFLATIQGAEDQWTARER
eukprot:gene1819-3526_t